MGSKDKVVHLQLPAVDLQRLDTWMPDIAATLRPGAPVAPKGNGEIRIGRRGSLAIYPDGGFMDYEADIGGHGAMALIAHLTEQEAAAVRRFALDWLRAYPGIGPLVPSQMNAEAAIARDQLHAARAHDVLMNLVPVTADTPSAINLIDRGLPGPYPGNLLGHLPLNLARLAEHAIVGLLTREDGTVIGVQLGYLTPAGD
jgi:hypothetical protein